jgi:hypothetical protein
MSAFSASTLNKLQTNLTNDLVWFTREDQFTLDNVVDSSAPREDLFNDISEVIQSSLDTNVQLFDGTVISTLFMMYSFFFSLHEIK